MFIVRQLSNIKKNKEENSHHITFHTCKFLPVYFMSLAEFLK